MRALYILRGAPGAGKSTWIRENEYEPLSVRPDAIRLAESGLVFDAEGAPSISQHDDKVVWNRVKDLVEHRMQKGLTTILDSTMADPRKSSEFRKLAERYRYRIYVVDFTTVDPEVCKERNAKRLFYRRVPEYVIDRMYGKFKRLDIPSSIPVLTPEEAKRQLDAPMPSFVDEYKAVNLIGDVHGCYTALVELLKALGGVAENDYLHPDELYVFLGDYLDRGIENAQTIEYIMQIAPHKNVWVLEGNHEKALSSWAHDEPIAGSDFSDTQKQLEEADVSKKEVRKFIRRLAQFLYCDYRGTKIFACHGGISSIPKPFAYVSSHDLISGFGVYKDVGEVEESWELSSRESGIVLVHGHRANNEADVHPYERVFCLEGGVEYGGMLRCVRFEGEEVSTYEVMNGVFRTMPSDINIDEEEDMERVIEVLRSNDCIVEKRFNEVSSFNFTNKAFLKGIWNTQSIHARGLFIDTEANRIKARSYDKFFNLEERPETSLGELRKTMHFPADIYLKENGYLGICASDGIDDLFTASKTSTTSDHARRFAHRLKTALGKKCSEFSRYLADNDLSAIFEVIEPDDDPHIVEYDEPRLVLLALVRNSMKFEQLPYLELRAIADRFHLEPKRLLVTVANFKEFCDWVNNLEDEDWKLNGEPIEGVVVEDSSGFMVKIKGQWYRKWKSVRGILKEIERRGRSSRIEAFRSYYKDADLIYEAAKEYVSNAPNRGKKRKGLCPPPTAENVIRFRNWYEQEFLNNR